MKPDKYLVRTTATVRDAMAVIDKGGIGMALLVDGEGRLLRTVTDGDLRRLLLGTASLHDCLALLDQSKSWTLPIEAAAAECLALMKDKSVDAIPLLDTTGRPRRIALRSDFENPILLSTPHMGEEELEFIRQAFATNWIAPLGPNVDAFEKELAEKVGVGHAAAVNSGTSAIHLALRILDVGPDDTVFCSTFTFAASANPIVYQGAQPVFIDSEGESWNMCPHALERALNAAASAGKLPKAVIVVSLYGQSADMDPIMELCDSYGVPVVEDAAESLGATYKGKASGTFGRMGIYSFNGNKIITTSGGGMLVSDDPDAIRLAKYFATQAREPVAHYEHRTVGYNYRMSNILAGVGRGQLRVLDERVAQRRAVYAAYREQLRDVEEIAWMEEPEWSFGTRWLSACSFQRGEKCRDAVIAALASRSIEARPVWKPMHLQPVFSECPFYSSGNTPLSDRLFESGICLPSGSNMRPDEVGRVVDAIRDALNDFGG